MFDEAKKSRFCVAILVVLVFLILLTAWMQRFQALSVGTDLMIFDKLTGKTTIVNSNGIATEVAGKGKVKSPKLEDINLPNLLSNAALSVKWRDGKLYYNFTVLTFSEIVSRGRSSGAAVLTIFLLDNDGFEMKSIDLSLNKMIKIVDEQGKVQSLNYASSAPMSYSDFKEISSWELSWAGFPEK